MVDSGPAEALSSTEPTTRQLGRQFWRLWTSAGLSNLADGVLKIALPLVAIRYTQSPTAIAGLAFALSLPWLLFALPAGALADRLDRRRAMLGANLVRSTLLGILVLAVVQDAGSIGLLYIAASASAAPRPSTTPPRSRSCRRLLDENSYRGPMAGSSPPRSLPTSSSGHPWAESWWQRALRRH